MTIQELKNFINKDDFSGQALPRPWGGAGVIMACRVTDRIASFKAMDNAIQAQNENFVPNRIIVVTKYASELTWLFYKCKTIFNDKIHSMNKYYFYGMMAETANLMLDEDTTCNRKQLLLNVLQTAESIFSKH
jgi:hypothetical protein